MSGFEVAGITLAVLPLLISVASSYDNCLTPFSRFKKFPKEAKQFIKLFEAQNAIFNNQCRILLADIIEHDAAASMLESSDHPSWRDPKLDQQLVELLDKSKAACVATIELIAERLTDVKSKCQGLVAAIEDDNMEHNTETKLSLTVRMATKIRFSFSKSSLDQDIAALRALNDDFGTLACQSMKLELRSPRPSEKACQEAEKEIEKEIQKYNFVGRASRKVYEALGQACTKHVEHLAHTCAEVEYTTSNDGCSPQIKFRMALAGSTKEKDPISFIVDTTLDDCPATENLGPTCDSDELGNTLKRRLERPPDHTERRAKKSIRFESSVAIPTPMHFFLPIANHSSLQGHLHKDFCDHLRRCRSQPIQPHISVGTLEIAGGCTNSVFLVTANNCTQSQQAVSLGQLIASLSRRKNNQSFQLHERLHLAKVLTIAVLQYRSTPWLQMSWKSNDVIFFSSDAESMLRQQSALTAPHFNARVKASEDSSMGGLLRTDNALGARNPLLYSLGIVLLEVGYWTNWECLSQPSRGQDRYTDFFQARKLLKSGCSDMGPRYDMMVEKLIECDFGCGDDLNQRSLQMAVYREVVSPLEKLAAGFKALQVEP